MDGAEQKEGGDHKHLNSLEQEKSRTRLGLGLGVVDEVEVNQLLELDVVRLGDRRK